MWKILQGLALAALVAVTATVDLGDSTDQEVPQEGAGIPDTAVQGVKFPQIPEVATKPTTPVVPNTKTASDSSSPKNTESTQKTTDTTNKTTASTNKTVAPTVLTTEGAGTASAHNLTTVTPTSGNHTTVTTPHGGSKKRKTILIAVLVPVGIIVFVIVLVLVIMVCNKRSTYQRME